MRFVYRQLCCVLVAAHLPVAIMGIDAPLQGHLTFEGVKKAALISQVNRSGDFPELLSLLSIHDSFNPLIVEKQSGKCPPGYPLRVGRQRSENPL